jgi:hypothetical protein
MSIDEFFSINALSLLHNDNNIIFCKTDYLLTEFIKIKNLNHNIILITGNSDYSVTSELSRLAPQNVIKWYAQNALCENNIVEPIPIGLVNGHSCYRANHGTFYSDIYQNTIKSLNASILNRLVPDKNIYANFNIHTNLTYRSNIKRLCKQNKDINWHEPNLSSTAFCHHISSHKMVVCPLGNGFDTHRLWETLYLGRVPIFIKPKNLATDCYEAHGITRKINEPPNHSQSQKYSIYQLYKQLPIIILDNAEDLLNSKLIFDKYDQILNTTFDLSILNTSHWINLITNTKERLIS